MLNTITNYNLHIPDFPTKQRLFGNLEGNKAKQQNICANEDNYRKFFNATKNYGLVNFGVKNFSEIEITETPKETIDEFFELLQSKKCDEIFGSETLANYFKERGKEGIELKYPRKQFMHDLNEIFAELPESEVRDITKKIGIKIKSDNPIFYDGILTGKNLDECKIPEHKVKELINKFTQQNEVVTPFKNFNELMNSFIRAFPEFINTIGKKQFGVHNFSLDIHTLSTFNYLIKALNNTPDNQPSSDAIFESKLDDFSRRNYGKTDLSLEDKLFYCEAEKNYGKEYNILAGAENIFCPANMTNNDKLVLKMSALFHDIAKAEGTPDERHPLNSALYISDILKKTDLPDFVKTSIVTQIKNHHWYKDANKKDLFVSADYFAKKFDTKEDWDIAKILTDADIHNIDPNFLVYIKLHSKNLDSLIADLKKFCPSRTSDV